MDATWSSRVGPSVAWWGVLAVLALGPGGASSPAPAAASAARAAVLVVGASAFLPACFDPPFTIVEDGLRRGFASVGGACPLVTTLSLPEHAEVAAVEADVCDSSAVGDITVTLVRATRLATTQEPVVGGSTSGAPGCVTLTLEPTTPVSTADAYLGVVVLLGESTSPEQVTLQGLRVRHTGR